MISSPGCLWRGAVTPGSKSTRTWMASRPGMLRSWRWRSVRLTPACCAGVVASSIAATSIPVAIMLPPTSALAGQAKRPKCFSKLAREQLRLLPGREVAAFVDFVEIGQVGISTMSPRIRRTVDVFGEHGDRDRKLDLRRLPRSRARGIASTVFPVEARGRGRGVGEPIKRDVIQDFVFGGRFVRILAI